MGNDIDLEAVKRATMVRLPYFFPRSLHIMGFALLSLLLHGVIIFSITYGIAITDEFW